MSDVPPAGDGGVDRAELLRRAQAALERRHLIGVPDGAEVWLVRHADAYQGLSSIGGGRLDPPLSPLGRRQARALADRLCAVPIDEVWASDLRRAAETAAEPAARRGLDVLEDVRLREVRTHWDAGGVPPTPEAGAYHHLEPHDELVARIDAVVRDIAAGLGPGDGTRPRRAVAVSHAAAIMAYVTHLLGMDWGRLPLAIHFTSVTVVAVRGEQVVLHSIADATHLATLTAGLG